MQYSTYGTFNVSENTYIYILPTSQPGNYIPATTNEMVLFIILVGSHL